MEPRNRSQPGGPVQQPYLSYRPARLHSLAESIPRNRFLGSINVYKYGLSTITLSVPSPHWLFKNSSSDGPVRQTGNRSLCSLKVYEFGLCTTTQLYQLQFRVYKIGYCAGTFKPSLGARNREGKGWSCRPARAENLRPAMVRGIDSRNRVWNWVAKLHRLAGRYDNPVPTWFLAPIAGLKLPTQVTQHGGIGSLESTLGILRFKNRYQCRKL